MLTNSRFDDTFSFGLLIFISHKETAAFVESKVLSSKRQFDFPTLTECRRKFHQQQHVQYSCFQGNQTPEIDHYWRRGCRNIHLTGVKKSLKIVFKNCPGIGK